MAAKAAGVSTQGFYNWCRRIAAGPSDVHREEASLIHLIRKIHKTSDSNYGEPRVTAELHRLGYRVNHKRVERLMRIHGIAGVHKPATVRTTIPAEENPAIPDLLGRNFTPSAPGRVWVGDITYIRTSQGWLYLASVLDLGSRRLLGYSMASHMRTELVEDALKMAVATRGGNVEGIIFHGDRGSQYMPSDYRELLGGHKMKQSVGRVGACYDNAVAESFWSSLKREAVSKYRFETHSQARQVIFKWINNYNNTRLHSSLGYCPPIEWEAMYQQLAADPCSPIHTHMVQINRCS